MEDLQSEAIQQLVENYEAALADGPEESIQTFLNENSILFDALSHHRGVIKLPKLKLGSEYVTDFVLLHGVPRYSNTRRPGVTFIELERADRPLFTAAGDPSSTLTHAIRQVQDWRNWIEPNMDYTARLLKAAAESAIAELPPPSEGDDDMWNSHLHDISEFLQYGFSSRCLVVAGRRGTMSMSQRLRLERMNCDLNGIEIMTFDEIMDRFLHRLRWLRNSGHPYVDFMD
jgi:hypothetical protein